MAAANYLQSEDQFLCSICLDVFTDPVSTPCGHNFCKNCITKRWNISNRCLCPICKESFTTRPDLRVNTFISEMVAQFRRSAQQKASSSSSEQQVSKPGEVPCDVCTGTKLKALKSCLVCLVSYCETHLEPHLKMSGLKRHQLIDPVENLEDRMCTKHDKPLELFCKTDQTCVRMLCTVLEHKMHDVVPLKEGYEGKKAKLGKTEADIQQMIQKRCLKIQNIKHSVDLKTSDHKMHDVVPLKEEYKGKKAEVSVHPSTYEGTVARVVAQLEETLGKEMKKRLPESELKRVQQYAVDVTLDPDTAHPKLILSDDGKQVHVGDVWKILPNNPERFSYCGCILGKQSFSSGRFYFEVQVKGKTKWTFGVARESINRKGDITLSPQKGFWTIWLRNGNEYKALADPPVLLSLKSPPQKVGVFVDYEESRVSFYDVEYAALIYSFTGCSFNEKLFPYFSPCDNEGGKNSAPLIISPVRVN